ncbi:MAG: type II toxin-antitoxin system PemK/MazF family toxin [Chitinophagaceae bacterium]|nr:type II toxin-antitoxin system PemK/MazF family toxin [Anaerolineae bacterium]
MNSSTILRGQIWEVRFDPSEGDEIKKIRPAVVMTAQDAGRMQLHIVVPITGWQSQFSRYFWMRRLEPTSRNGLKKESAADAFQVRSLSIGRFQTKLGQLTPDEMDRIATAVAYCIDYKA